jgi:hypothetical protein
MLATAMLNNIPGHICITPSGVHLSQACNFFVQKLPGRAALLANFLIGIGRAILSSLLLLLADHGVGIYRD